MKPTFSKPRTHREQNEWYRNGVYASEHCPNCGEEDFHTFYHLYDYDGVLFEDKDHLLDYLEEQGYTEDEIKDIIKHEVFKIEEVNI